MRQESTFIAAMRKVVWLSVAFWFSVVATQAGQPVFEWATQPGPGSAGEPSEAFNVQVDAANNSYVIGDGGPTTLFGVALSTRSPYLAKFSPTGRPLWVVRAPPDITQMWGLIVTPAGDCYISAVSASASDIILKFDTSGKLSWRSSTRPHIFQLVSLSSDLNNNLIMTGSGLRTGRFCVIAVFDSEMNLSWSYTHSSLNPDLDVSFSRSASDSDKNLFVAGYFSGLSMQLGSTVLTNTTGSASQGFLSKFNFSGQPVWVVPIGRDYSIYPSQLGVDKFGACYVLASYQVSSETAAGRINVQPPVLLKFDADGTLLWRRDLSPPPNDVFVRSLAVNSVGECLISAQFRNVNGIGGQTTLFGGSSITNQGLYDGLISKFDSSGALQWVVTVGTAQDDSISSASWDGAGNVRIAGAIHGNASFGNLGFLSASSDRMFVASLTESPRSPSILSQPANQVFASGDTARISVSAEGTPLVSYVWLKEGISIGAPSSSNLIVSNFQLSDTGTYSVVVSSPFGSVTSAPIVLTLGYRLGVHTTGQGRITRSPDVDVYPPSSIVEITATPGDLDDFLGWSGDASGNATTTTVLLDTNRSVIAHFVNTTLQLSSVGNGSITQSPSQSHYHLGNFVRLTAVPDRWFRFSHWEDGSISNPRTIAVGTNNHFTASFEPAIPLETLTFNGVSRIAPVGMPAVFVNGVFTTNLTLHSVGPISIGLTSSFDHGLIFYSLDGSPPTLLDRISDGRPFLLTWSATLRVIAVDEMFSQMEEWDSMRIEIEPGFQLHLTSGRGGSVTTSPKLTESTYYSSNLVVSLSAIPNEGSTFLQWLGDAEGTNPIVSMTMNRDRCVEAIFGTTLRRVSSTGGILQISPDLPVYPYDSIVDLTAIADSGNTFAVWSGAVHGATNPVRFTITQPVPTIAAGFASLPAGESALTVFHDGLGTVSVHPPGNRFRTAANVTLTAVPDEDQSFIGWAGDASGTKNPIQISMNQTRRIIARFTKRPRLEFNSCSSGAGGGRFEFQLWGEAGATFTIEQASNPGGPWTLVSTVRNDLGKVQLSVPAETRSGRFFRASLVQ